MNRCKVRMLGVHNCFPSASLDRRGPGGSKAARPPRLLDNQWVDYLRVADLRVDELRAARSSLSSALITESERRSESFLRRFLRGIRTSPLRPGSPQPAG